MQKLSYMFYRTPGNKTLQYYAIKVLRFLRQLHLSDEWAYYLSLPQKKQILEKGAVFVAQWCQPHIEIRWKDIAAKLDNLAKQVNMNYSLRVGKDFLKLITCVFQNRSSCFPQRIPSY